MKIKDLPQWPRETLKFAARPLLDGPCMPLADPPTAQQLHSLKVHGYFIGPDQEVLRCDMFGMLRECVHGIPCTYDCQGWTSGRCSQRPFPKCGVADGACLLTGKLCNSSCKGREGFESPSWLKQPDTGDSKDGTDALG